MWSSCRCQDTIWKLTIIEDRAELRRLSPPLVTLCIQTLSIRRITDSSYTHGGNGYIELVKAKESKRRQKVGYFPGACLARASSLYITIYGGYTVYTKHYATYFVKGAHARTAKSERVISRWQVIRDLSALYATSASDVPLRCNIKIHGCVGARRRHVSNVGQPSGTTREGTALDRKLNFVYHGRGKYPREDIIEPLCVTLWTRTFVLTTGDRFTPNECAKSRRMQRMHLGKETCDNISDTV